MKKKVLFLIIPITVIIFNILVIFNPAPIMEAAKTGAILWFNSVLPSLLPFMIGCNILLKLGTVDFLGALLEPVMRPLFGVSGKGAFALVMGATSGYPVGAQICASLRESEKISGAEAQRLMSFVNNSGPLFIIGAIGVGMFGNERIGFFILAANLSGALLSGLLFRFYKHKKEDGGRKIKPEGLKAARHKPLAAAKITGGQPFGRIMSESIYKALESLLYIAGFIMLFSVLLKILEITGLIGAAVLFLHNLGIPGGKELIEPAIYGFFEITNGAAKLARTGTDRTVVVLTAAFVAFGGLSIFSQSLAFLSKTDVKPSVFFFSKLLNAALTAAVGFLLYPLWDFEDGARSAVPAFATAGPMDRLVLSTVICAMALLTVLISSFAVSIAGRLYKTRP